MSIVYKISNWNRNRKWGLFLKEFKIEPTNRVLDVGFNDIEYDETTNYLEKHYPYSGQITALSTDTAQEFAKKYPQIKTIHYNGGVFPFADGTFDICWSNAVLEHVGDRQKQVEFLRQIKRVASRSFVTTPNLYFPVEIHTRIPLLHWLPQKAFDWFLAKVDRSWADSRHINLLSYRELKNILSAAGIEKYRVIKNKFLFFTLDFVIIF